MRSSGYVLVVLCVLAVGCAGGKPKPDTEPDLSGDTFPLNDVTWKGSFDFDHGTTEGFTGSRIYDDQGRGYGSIYNPTHYLEAQWNWDFPLPVNYPYRTARRGVLNAGVGAFGPEAARIRFPSTSKYWYMDVKSPDLRSVNMWQGAKEVEAWVMDLYTGLPPSTKSELAAKLMLRIDDSGTSKTLEPATYTGLTHQKWTKLSATFTVPPTAKVQNVIIRFKGGWAVSNVPPQYKRPTYEGGVYIDHVRRY